MVGDVIPLNDLWCVLLGREIYWTTTHVSSDEKLYLAKALRHYRKTHGSLCLGGYFVDAIVARLMEEKDAGLGFCHLIAADISLLEHTHRRLRLIQEAKTSLA